MPSDSPSDHVVAVNYVHSYGWNRGSKICRNFMAFGIQMQPAKRRWRIEGGRPMIEDGGSKMEDRISILDFPFSIPHLRSFMLYLPPPILFPISAIAVILKPAHTIIFVTDAVRIFTACSNY
jgi:hypothetical protein